MRKKIPLELSADGVDKALKEVKAYKKWIKKKVKELVSLMCEEGTEIAINSVMHIDTGETLNSIQGTVSGNKGVIVAGGNAIWIEFGTGVTYNGAVGSSPHPKGEEFGYLIGEYGKGHGADEDGWWYWDESEGKYRHTFGIASNPFLYNTAQELKRIAPDLAKEVIKFD